MPLICRKIGDKGLRAVLKGMGLSLFLGIALSLCTLMLYIVFAPAPPLWEGIDFSRLVVDRNGELMRMGLNGDDKYRLYTPLDQIPLHVRRAVILYEDKHFYKHPGVNVFATAKAALSLIQGGRRVGASTIAMQVARLRYGLASNTVDGKLRQMLLALQLVWHYGHDTVLEAYFSLAPYGGNIEGIEAAARTYFHHSVQDLTHSQALALCLIPQNPTTRAFQGGKQGKLIFNTDLEEMRSVLHGRWNKAYPDEPVPPKAPPLRVYARLDLPFIAPHLTTELFAAVPKDAFASSQIQEHDTLKQSKKPSAINNTIKSTVDSVQQAFLERHIRQFLAQTSLYGVHNASALLLHWPSMEVRALVGSANFFDTAISGQVDGTKARRSPGSTLKPFIYALALEQGLIHPHSMLMDAPRRFAEYNPENFDKEFRGPLSATEALQSSRNVPAIELASRIHPTLYTFLQRAQVSLPHHAGHYGLSLVLGGAEMRLRDLVGLYAMLANGGVWQPLRMVKGRVEQESASHPLLSPEAALATLYMLEEPKKSQSFAQSSIPFRYKTGTSNGFRDAWTVGIVGPYILGIWIGNFDNSSNPMFVGNRVATPLYKRIANALVYEKHQEEDMHDIIAQKHSETALIKRSVCKETGDVQTELCPETVDTWFIPGRSPMTNTHIYRKIWIDSESGLRLCAPFIKDNAHAREVVWEFWPTEMYKLFSKAGIYKPMPPEWSEECRTVAHGAQKTMDKMSYAHEKIMALSISSPQGGIVYHAESTGTASIAFTANSSADAKNVFWFVNDAFVGSRSPQETFFHPVKVGTHKVRVLDDLGQASSITIYVK